MTEQRAKIKAEAFRRALDATTRAISGSVELEITHGGDNAAINNSGRVRLPSVHAHHDQNDIAHIRGEADAVAIRLRHHDAHLHQKFMPSEEEARPAFEALEAARCEALGTKDMSGLADNLAAALEHRHRKMGLHEARSQGEVPIAEVLRLLAREVLTGAKPGKSAAKAVELWRPLLQERIAKNLEALGNSIGDQAGYAELARELLVQLDLTRDDSVPPMPDPEKAEEEQEESEGSDMESQGRGEADESMSSIKMEEAPQSDLESGNADLLDAQQQMEASLPPEGEDPAGEMESAQRLPNTPEQTDPERYHPFTTEFDEIITAEELCDPEELSRLRQMLDHQLQHMHGLITRLANRLQRRLLAHQTRSWEFDLEEGLLDTSRLARVVANPMTPLSFKMEKQMEFRDTIVTLLLDNSGSMRGRPIGIAAMSADILARTLERCGVKVEILGFTTRAWKGGQSREKWLEAGKPPKPGRLNDLRHIIYKSADAPWRRTHKNLGLMLREGLLKENIDGEALLWAYHRQLARPEQRRILMVISDGAPVDDTTQSVNASTYLEQHLRDVIDLIENYSETELVAIGIGHDVTRWYKKAVTIMDVDQLGSTMMHQLITLFDENTISSR